MGRREKAFSMEMVKVIFTSIEINTMAKELAGCLNSLREIEKQKSSAMSDFKSRLEKIALEVDEFQRWIYDGYAMKNERCEIIPDFETKRMIYYRLDQFGHPMIIVKDRAMNPDEIQRGLFDPPDDEPEDTAGDQEEAPGDQVEDTPGDESDKVNEPGAVVDAEFEDGESKPPPLCGNCGAVMVEIDGFRNCSICGQREKIFPIPLPPCEKCGESSLFIIDGFTKCDSCGDVVDKREDKEFFEIYGSKTEPPGEKDLETTGDENQEKEEPEKEDPENLSQAEKDAAWKKELDEKKVKDEEKILERKKKKAASDKARRDKKKKEKESLVPVPPVPGASGVPDGTEETEETEETE